MKFQGEGEGSNVSSSRPPIWRSYNHGIRFDLNFEVAGVRNISPIPQQSKPIFYSYNRSIFLHNQDLTELFFCCFASLCLLLNCGTPKGIWLRDISGAITWYTTTEYSSTTTFNDETPFDQHNRHEVQLNPYDWTDCYFLCFIFEQTILELSTFLFLLIWHVFTCIKVEMNRA